MAKDFNDLTAEEAVLRINALKKMAMWFALLFSLFGFSVLFGVMSFGFQLLNH